MPADPDTLLPALRQVVEHHDVFRLRFFRQASGWRQEYVPDSPPAPIDIVYLADVADGHLAAAIAAVAESL